MYPDFQSMTLYPKDKMFPSSPDVTGGRSQESPLPCEARRRGHYESSSPSPRLPMHPVTPSQYGTINWQMSNPGIQCYSSGKKDGAFALETENMLGVTMNKFGSLVS
jgi:hypothetical protein